MSSCGRIFGKHFLNKGTVPNIRLRNKAGRQALGKPTNLLTKTILYYVLFYQKRVTDRFCIR